MNRNLIGVGLALILTIAFGSCKPKQSAYKSVYEAAKERELEESYVPPTVTPQHTNDYYEAIKIEKVTPVYESDAPDLKAYSVVIAAMGMKPNAESLKKRMENEGYKVILVQNEQGMYRVIIASYDSKEQAIAKKNAILADFASKGDLSALKSKYGIPFTDWWILQRQY